MSTELAIRTPKDLLTYFDNNSSAIESVLPKHLHAARMKRLAVGCFRAQTATGAALRKCTPQSILDSVVTAALLGLEPGVAGQGFMIPYGTTCTFVPGWQGLVGLLNNTGRATAWTGAVYEGDVWDYQKGSRPRCVHIPGVNDGNPDKLTWVYACGRVNGSEQEVIEAWPMERVWRHRDRYNKVGKRHYSYEHPELYGRKVVLLQVLKYMPRSIELNNAITAADAAEMGQTTRVEDSVVIIDPEPTDLPQAKPKFEAPKGINNTPPLVTEEPKKAVAKVADDAHPKDRLLAAGVSFEDFTGWCVTTGRYREAGDWLAAAAKGDAKTPAAQYAHVPDDFWTTLEMDPVAVGKCVVLYSTVGQS